MKTNNFISYTFFLSMILCGFYASAQNTELRGEIKGLLGDTVEVSYFVEGLQRTDTVISSKDSFIWKGQLNEPQQIGISIAQSGSFYFVDPGQIKLKGIKNSAGSFQISGSQTQLDERAFLASIQDVIDQQNKLYEGFDKMTDVQKQQVTEKKDELNRQRRIRANQFVINNPKSFYSLYLLSFYNSEYADIKSLFDTLDTSIRETYSGKQLARKLDVMKRSLVGSMMIDFKQEDINGRIFEFSSFKGKYVLVDFWASWCVPCRQENPNLLKAYNTYKDKGFTIVGISLDNKAVNWKKAVSDDKMPWTQLSDLKGWKNEVSDYFGIQSIPSNYLIDPSGKIIARDLRGSELEMKLEKLFN